MKRFNFIVGVLLIMMSTSCIPHKDIVYLQNKENSVDSTYTQTLIEKQKPYRVQINDILSLRVKSLDQDNVRILNPIGDENLNASSDERAYYDGFTVDLHGNIRVPTLGYINVLGFTVEEIEKMIEKKLLEEQFKETANIFVTVKLSGFQYTANGEVARPGTEILFKDRVNIFEAIANVGEILVTGDRKDVLIIRQYPQGQKIHHLDLTNIKVMESPYYFLQPNDIIYVKPLKQKSIGTGKTAVETLSTVATVLSILTTTVLLITRL